MTIIKFMLRSPQGVVVSLANCYKSYLDYKLKKAIKKGYWNLYRGFSGLAGYNKGVAPIVYSIKSGIISNFCFSLLDRNEMIKDAFAKIVDHVLNENTNHIDLITQYTDYYPDVVIRLARGNSKLVQDLRIRLAILHSQKIKDYISELITIWNLTNSDFALNGNYQTQNLEDIYRKSIGAKNSAPMHLVKEMYELQAKGCPIPPNKNSSNNSGNGQSKY